MEFKDYYDILGVEADADAKAIKTAYRRLARKYHPDVSTENEAEARFKEVTEAYEVLGDSRKRAEYDELRQYGQRGQFEPPPDWQSSGGFSSNEHFYEGDFSEFFSSIFGGGQAGGFSSRNRSFSQPGQDIETDLPVFLEDTLKQESKSIEYTMPHIDSQGRREMLHKTLKVKVPAGVADGERIRLKGQGSPGIGDGPAGDLYLRIRLVPHPMFDVEGHNLTVTVPVAPWEAALGCKIMVPTLEGDIRLSIPPNSQTGQRLRIKGRGLVTKQKDGKGEKIRGDLFALLKVVMPTKSNDEIKQQWQKLADSAGFDPREKWRQS